MVDGPLELCHLSGASASLPYCLLLTLIPPHPPPPLTLLPFIPATGPLLPLLSRYRQCTPSHLPLSRPPSRHCQCCPLPLPLSRPHQDVAAALEADPSWTLAYAAGAHITQAEAYQAVAATIPDLPPRPTSPSFVNALDDQAHERALWEASVDPFKTRRLPPTAAPAAGSGSGSAAAPAAVPVSAAPPPMSYKDELRRVKRFIEVLGRRVRAVCGPLPSSDSDEEMEAADEMPPIPLVSTLCCVPCVRSC